MKRYIRENIDRAKTTDKSGLSPITVMLNKLSISIGYGTAGVALFFELVSKSNSRIYNDAPLHMLETCEICEER